MKKIFGIISLFLLLSFNTYAQPPEDMREHIDAIRVAYITGKLALTPEESQAFWAVYNQYDAERKALKKSLKRPRDFAILSDAEMEALILKRFEIEEQELALKRSYFPKLKEVLPIKKLARLPIIEREFKKELVRSMGERGERRKRMREH